MSDQITLKDNAIQSGLSRPAVVALISLVYFVSGTCSLIDEVVWVRLLKLVLGNTIYASSIVVSVFMGGLALGAFIMARYADAVKRPLRLYAILETLITIAALALPWELRLFDSFYVWFFRSWQPGHGALLFVQVIISAALLLVPSVLMGSTLPLLGRFITSLEKEAGHLVGRLYAINTLGAALGCFLAGFVFIRSFGVMGTVYAAAALNLLVALGGWILYCVYPQTQEIPQSVSLAEPVDSDRAPLQNKAFYLLVVAFFVSGLISIGYEIIWMRSIVHLLGGYTYVFSAVLTVYLLGNVIGAAIGSKLVKRLKSPAVAFAITLCILGIYGLFFLPVLIGYNTAAAEWTKSLVVSINNPGSSASYILGPLLQSFILFFIPTLIMGVGFPIALQAWANQVHKVGRSTGTAYAANTIGAVIGGLLTGFLLIPTLGVQLSISILGLVGIWAAAALGFVFGRKTVPLARWAFAAVVIVFTGIIFFMPTNLFRVVIKESPLIPDMGLVDVEEGLTTTVSVHKSAKEGAIYLYASGQSIAGTNFTARGDQKMMGHLGVMLNRNAQDVLSVGFGSGETTACLARHNLVTLDCVEIAPEVVRVALKYFREINLGDRLNEQVNMIYMDAKNYIHLTDSQYDIIVNDSIHPRLFAENASLYTRQYYQSAKDHLRENGLVISWLPTYSMPVSVYRSIIGTVLDVFPYVSLWYLTPHHAPLVLIIGSEQPQQFTPDYIEAKFLNEFIRDSLAEIDIHNSIDVLSCYICDERQLRKSIDRFNINSDYRPFVEFTTDTPTPHWEIFRQFVLENRTKTIFDHVNFSGLTEQQRQDWIAQYERIYTAAGYLFQAQASNNYLERLRYYIQGLDISPGYPALLNGKAEAEKAILVAALDIIKDNKIDESFQLASDILTVDPNSAITWMIRAEIAKQINNTHRALQAATVAVNLAPQNPDTHFILASIQLRLGKFEQAVTSYQKALDLAGGRFAFIHFNEIQILSALADAYAAAGRHSDAIAIASKALKLAYSSGEIEISEDIRKRLYMFKAANQQKPEP